MSDLYTSAGGSLKFISEKSKKKKKHKKHKKSHKEDDDIESSEPESTTVQKAQKRKTPAEIAFENSKRKKQEKELIKKAQKTHKERIMEFNEHLDSLSEHYDIPKVSWTK